MAIPPIDRRILRIWWKQWIWLVHVKVFFSIVHALFRITRITKFKANNRVNSIPKVQPNLLIISRFRSIWTFLVEKCCHIVNFGRVLIQNLQYYTFCIYTLPVNLKCTIWQCDSISNYNFLLSLVEFKLALWFWKNMFIFCHCISFSFLLLYTIQKRAMSFIMNLHYPKMLCAKFCERTI